MWYTFFVVFFVLVCAVSSLCHREEFNDEIMGKLIPCPWEKARGMLCVEAAPDVVVWPNKRQIQALDSCGISRSKRETVVLRSKRFAEYEDEPQPAKPETPFRAQPHDFDEILTAFVGRHFGRGQLNGETIPEDWLRWIENNVTLQSAQMKGYTRTFIGPADEFSQTNPNPVTLNNMRTQLQKKKTENPVLAWIDVDEIITELHICNRLFYSSVVDDSVDFDAPIGAAEGSSQRSSLAWSHFKVACENQNGVMVAILILYADRITFADVEREVQHWINTPETRVKWINSTKQKLVNYIRQEVHNKTSSEVGKRCTTYEVLADKLPPLVTKPRCDKKKSGFFGCFKFPEASTPIGKKCESEESLEKKWACLAVESGALKATSSQIFAPSTQQKGAIPGPPRRRKRGFLDFVTKGIKSVVRRAAGAIGCLFGKCPGSGGAPPPAPAGPVAPPPPPPPPQIIYLSPPVPPVVQYPPKLTKVHCEPYEIQKNDPVVFDLKDAKVLTEITPEKFVYEVNVWRNTTKTVFEAQRITPKQRKVATAYLRNAMLGYILDQYESFLD